MTSPSLDFGFYGEGPRDYGFLLPLVVRIIESNLPPSIDVRGIGLDNIPLGGMTQIEKMLTIAEAAYGYQLLIFHLDADSSNSKRAYAERFKPGYDKILENSSKYNTDIIPIIPVHMTDAWMLVDFEAFKQSVDIKDLTAEDLGFKSKPHEVEAIPDPKFIFEEALRMLAHTRSRPQRISPEGVYAQLAKKINLSLLEQVRAYQEFLKDLYVILHKLHFIPGRVEYLAACRVWWIADESNVR